MWLSAAPDNFTFSIKVNRYITDYTRLKGEKALEIWYKFKKTLVRIDDRIDFWLFKMPPSFKHTSENLQTVSKFFSEIKLNNKAVIEFRDPSWWTMVDKIEEIGIVFCSVDLRNYLALELSLIEEYTLEYMVIRNGINISILKQNSREI
jgi:uncharacterized protein YecE (DUF72 family)